MFYYIQGRIYTLRPSRLAKLGVPHHILGLHKVTNIQGVREISAIIVTDNYLCYKEPKNSYNFFLILIFNKLFTFKTLDEWQH